MDWELYERYRATAVLILMAFASFLLLAFQRTSAVRHLRTALVIGTLPTERFLSSVRNATPVEEGSSAVPVPAASSGTVAGATASSMPSWGVSAEHDRQLRTLADENVRLREMLELRQRRWPDATAAHVVGRDPQRWFQEIVLDKGKEDGLAVDDPVIAIADGREGLVGRITEVAGHVAKVMLVQDSLSAVPAAVVGATLEDGVAEGNNGHDLILRYLDRSSRTKIGDPVVTSGLGSVFPDGIPIGWVQDVSLDPRQLFLQARVRPAVQTSRLRVVLVLRHTEGIDLR